VSVKYTGFAAGCVRRGSREWSIALGAGDLIDG
jgi:hypothetical protein